VTGSAADQLMQVQMDVMSHATCSVFWGEGLSTQHHICIGKPPDTEISNCEVNKLSSSRTHQLLAYRAHNESYLYFT